jgi:hypothetical protein
VPKRVSPFGLHHTDQVRAKIKTGVLMDRLQKNAMGEIEMTRDQIKSAEILLDRSLPKLQQIQHSGDSQNPLRHEFVWSKPSEP